MRQCRLYIIPSKYRCRDTLFAATNHPTHSQSCVYMSVEGMQSVAACRCVVVEILYVKWSLWRRGVCTLRKIITKNMQLLHEIKHPYTPHPRCLVTSPSSHVWRGDELYNELSWGSPPQTTKNTPPLKGILEGGWEGPCEQNSRTLIYADTLPLCANVGYIYIPRFMKRFGCASVRTRWHRVLHPSGASGESRWEGWGRITH